uniref:N-acylglucosamine 2-epimerase n=1 Tax=Streptomyces sp. NBC_00049 TaxID=2903617 RepID=A0AAU2JXM5_9ACTN
MTATRLGALALEDARLHALAERLLALAEAGLPAMYLPDAETFVFTRVGRISPDGTRSLEDRGTSTRYAAITALGARFLPEDRQRALFDGRTAEEFTGLLVERLPGVVNLGDAALIAWAAAETGHAKLSDALARVAELDVPGRPQYTVEAAWVLSALAAARATVDVEGRIPAARDRLLGARVGDGPLFAHATAPGLVPDYRSHVACFADQTYPLQALARLHAGGADPQALAAADACAARICALQGDGGQWWWHYDARRGTVVEGYPVYSVHQHAMAPTALFDLAEAGGTDFGAEIRRGLRWMTDVPELAGPTGTPREPVIHEALGVTWRKVYRGDPKKAVRAARGLTTRVIPGARLAPLDRIFRPLSVDRECRPYEFGWMLFAWLGGPQR